MEDSPEIKTLRCAFSHLVNTISVDSVLPDARATELITRRDYENCTAEPTESKQAEKFLKYVEKAVIANPRKFDLFLSILKQKDIADYLRKLRNCCLISVQESTGARVYLPDKIKVVHKLTDLEKAYSVLLAKFEATILAVLGGCTSTQQDVFISTLQNMLDKEDFVDFRSGFKHLKKEITLFNVKYLKDTVEFLPEEEMRTKPDELLTGYEEKLRDFMAATTVDDYKRYCKEHLLKLISCSAEPVTMKLSDQWMKRTLDNLKMLTCKLLKVPGSRLHFHTITEDCIAVHWLCPISVVPALKEVIVSATDALKQEGIMQIFIGSLKVMVPTNVPQLKILVCGRTGVGKSSLINSLLGREMCKVQGAASGEYSMTTPTKITVCLKGIEISIFDSPGIQDGNIEEAANFVNDMYGKCKDVDLVLYCLDISTCHSINIETSIAITLITKQFGPGIWERCIFVLTKANLFYAPLSVISAGGGTFLGLSMRQAIENYKYSFKSFQEKICSLAENAGVPEDIFGSLHVVAAGNFDPRETSGSIESNRMIIFASEHCQADPGPPIVLVDFIPEIWVTCLETVPVVKCKHYLQATALGAGRIKNPTEDMRAVLKEAAKYLAKEIHDYADEAIIYDRNPPTLKKKHTTTAATVGVAAASAGSEFGSTAVMTSTVKAVVSGFEEELTCPVCLALFTTPKTLPCFDTFCEECLKGVLVLEARYSLNGEVTKLTCPACRQQHDLPPNGVEGFTTNFTTTNLLELFNLNNSEVASAAEVGGMKQLEQKRYCADHEGEELKLYCRTCQEVICRDCTIVTHKQHDYTFIKDVREELTKKMESLITNLDRKKAGYQNLLDSIHHASKKEQHKVLEQQARVRIFIDTNIQKLESEIDDLECKKAVLYTQISLASSSYEEQLREKEDNLQLSRVQLISAVEYAQQLISSANSVELAMMSRQVIKQMEILQRTQLQEKPIEDSSWSLYLSKHDPLKSKVLSSPKVATLLYDFEAKNDKQVSCRADELVTVLGTVENGWLEVEKSDGRVGLIPEKLVKQY